MLQYDSVSQTIQKPPGLMVTVRFIPKLELEHPTTKLRPASLYILVAAYAGIKPFYFSFVNYFTYSFENGESAPEGLRNKKS